MFKKIKYIILIILLAGVAYGAYSVLITPKQIIPLPYKMSYRPQANEIEAAQNADILVIGDAMGRTLDAYLPEIIDKASVKLRNPLTIYNWSKEHEGLHRTLYKMRFLKKWPKLVLYFGGSEENYELAAWPGDFEKIKINIERYSDKRILSTIMTFPWLSKFVYKAVKQITIGNEVRPFEKETNFFVRQRMNELAFSLFKIEFDYLLTIGREHNSRFIVITPPIKLDQAPREVCDNATSNSVIIEQNDIKNLIEAGLDKDAHQKALELLSVTKGNAFSHYLVGKTALNLGNYKKARDELTMAHAFDCRMWRAHPVINSIIRKSTERENIRLIDFDQTMALLLGRELLFFDEKTPQHIYFKDLQRSILLQVKEIFKL